MSEVAVRQPWDRKPGESKQSFHSFSVYRDLGPTRSLAKAALLLGKAEGTLHQQSTKNGWVERAEAWDFYRDRLRQQEIIEQERQAFEQQRDLGRVLRISAAVRMTGRAAGMRGDKPIEEVEPLDLNTLDAADVARLAAEGVKIERLALGLPTDLSKGLDSFSTREVVEIVQQLVDGALERMPEDEHEGFVLFVRSIGVGRRNGG